MMMDTQVFHFYFENVDEAIERRKNWIRDTIIEEGPEDEQINHWADDILFLEKIRNGIEVETIEMVHRLLCTIDSITLGEYKLDFGSGAFSVIIIE